MTCPHCDQPARPPRVICDTCHEHAARLLGDTPAVVAMLNVTITRQAGIDYRAVAGGNTGKPAERPMPINLAAADVLRDLHAVLVAWVLWCREERSDGPADPWPTNDPAGCSAWLLGRLEWLSRTELAGEFVREVDEAHRNALRAVDSREPKALAGFCHCGHPLRARRSDTWVTCPDCGEGHDPAITRADALGEAGDLERTAGDIAKLAGLLGITADRDKVRKRILQWHRRGQVQAVGETEQGWPLFAYRDVVPMLFQHYMSEVAA